MHIELGLHQHGSRLTFLVPRLTAFYTKCVVVEEDWVVAKSGNKSLFETNLPAAISFAPRASHPWYIMQGCAVDKDMQMFGREPSCCRPNSDYR